jgi:hypothetical protein
MGPTDLLARKVLRLPHRTEPATAKESNEEVAAPKDVLLSRPFGRRVGSIIGVRPSAGTELANPRLALLAGNEKLLEVALILLTELVADVLLDQLVGVMLRAFHGADPLPAVAEQQLMAAT